MDRPFRTYALVAIAALMGGCEDSGDGGNGGDTALVDTGGADTTAGDTSAADSISPTDIIDGDTAFDTGVETGLSDTAVVDEVDTSQGGADTADDDTTAASGCTGTPSCERLDVYNCGPTTAPPGCGWSQQWGTYACRGTPVALCAWLEDESTCETEPTIEGNGCTWNAGACGGSDTLSFTCSDISNSSVCAYYNCTWN